MWLLDSTSAVARLELPGWSGTVDLNQPALGFRPEVLGGTPAKHLKSLLAIDLMRNPRAEGKVRPVEFFVRGDDLVAYYPEATHRIRSQVYWRFLPATPTCPEFGLEVIASVETDLLDGDPKFVARSEVTAGEFGVFADVAPHFRPLTLDPATGGHEFRPSPAGLWVQQPETGKIYLELPHPRDTVATRLSYCGAAGNSAQSLRIEHDLLHEFLEKGVLRRCRLRGVFLPPDDAAAVGQQALARFLTAELPLTA